VSDVALQNVADVSGILNQSLEYLEQDFQERCKRTLVADVTEKNYVESYLDLKYNL